MSVAINHNVNHNSPTRDKCRNLFEIHLTLLLQYILEASMHYSLVVHEIGGVVGIQALFWFVLHQAICFAPIELQCDTVMM